MKSTKIIRNLAEANGWKQNGQTTIGMNQNYWYSVTQTGSLSPIFITTSLSDIQSITQEQLKSAVMSIKKNYKIIDFNTTESILVFKVNYQLNAERCAGQINKLIRELSIIFSRLGLESACGLCADKAPLEFVRFGDLVGGICSECQNKLNQEYSEIKEKNSKGGNYVSGTIGALLGAMIGSALWLLVSYLGYYASIVGLAMAFLGQAGYRLFRGRIQKGMPWIVLISVVIGILVANTIEIAIGLSQDPEIGISMFDALLVAPQAFFNTEMFYVGTVWKEVAVGLFFALLGSWNTIRNLRSETSGQIYQIERI